MRPFRELLRLVLLLSLPAVVQAQFTYTAAGGRITITGYSGLGGGVIIPDTINSLPVTSIGIYAFESCTNVTSVTIGTNVTSIGDYAFESCSSLTNVTVPKSVTSIGAGAFESCDSLTDITVDPLNLVYSSVDGVLFNKSQTTLIECPGGKTGIYTLPNSVTSIAQSSFYYCHSLTGVTLGTNVSSIGDSAFESCSSLTNVTIPKSVTSIGATAFRSCISLTEITVDPLNSFFSSLDGVLFNKSQTTLIECPAGRGGSYTVPLSVANIGNSAFVVCRSLTSVTVGASVASIGDYAFAVCTGLTNVTIGANVTNIGIYAFYACTSLTDVTVPDKVISIGGNAFAGCSSLTSATIGTNVTSIGTIAFGSCTSLTSLIIPSSVTNIGTRAFAFCTSLKGVYFNGNAPTAGTSVFASATNAPVYFLPGTTGWVATFGGRPTALWLPQAERSGASFGVQSNQFGFNITWASGQIVVVEACADLANPTWVPLQTNTLTGAPFHFSDPAWTNYPARSYRIRSL